MDTALMEKIISLAKRRGFIYPSSEIYGGIAGFWDYGPLGVELKRNIKNEWWKSMVQVRDDVVGLDAYHHESQSMGSIGTHVSFY